MKKGPRLEVNRSRLAHWRIRRAWRRLPLGAPPSSLSRCEFSICSQNGEDGVLRELFRRMGARHRWFVEFGVGGGTEGCAVLLADHDGWNGLFIEANSDNYGRLAARYRDNPRVSVRHALVTPQSIECLLEEAGVPPEIDLLSIDIDGNDFWVWQALGSVRPRVVVLEYNGSLPLERQLVMPPDDRHHWDGTDYFGASLGAFAALGQSKGYELVHTDTTGVNAFFVCREELPALEGLVPDPPRAANYFGLGLRHRRDPLRRPYLDLERGRTPVGPDWG